MKKNGLKKKKKNSQVIVKEKRLENEERNYCSIKNQNFIESNCLVLRNQKWSNTKRISIENKTMSNNFQKKKNFLILKQISLNNN